MAESQTSQPGNSPEILNDGNTVVIVAVNWNKRIALDKEDNQLTVVGFLDDEGDETQEREGSTAAIAQYTTGPYTGQWVAFETDGFEFTDGGNC